MRRDARIGLRIREARLAAGLTLAQAGGTRISPPHLCSVEKGHRGIRADRLVYLAERLGIPLAHFLPDRCDPKDLEALIQAGEEPARRGEYSRAAAVYADVLPRIPQDRRDLAARCRLRLGYALVRLQQYELALPHLTEGIARAEETGDRHLIAIGRNAKGVYHLAQDEHRRAAAEFEGAVSVLRTHPRPSAGQMSAVLINLGNALLGLGRDQEALGYLEEAARLAAETGDRLQMGMIARNAADALLNLRRYPEARRRLAEAGRHFTEAERLDLVAYVENGLGILLLELGKPGAAIPHLRRALRLCEQIPDDLRRARNLTELARAHVHLGRHDAALPLAREAIRLSIKVNNALEAARAEALRGEILAAKGRLAEAEAAFAYAIPIFEEHEQHKDLIRAYALLGMVLQGQERNSQAAYALGRALELAGVNVSVH